MDSVPQRAPPEFGRMARWGSNRRRSRVGLDWARVSHSWATSRRWMSVGGGGIQRSTRPARWPGRTVNPLSGPLDRVLDRVRACRICEDQLEPRPVLRVATDSRVIIIGQAPGSKVHASGVPWNDPSGDLPPPLVCADGHPQLLAQMGQARLILVVGQYAQRQYLGTREPTLTETVRSFEAYLPRYFPLPHPSWRSRGWMKRNPWFGNDVLPRLRALVAESLDN